MHALAARGVTKRFGPRTALAGIDLSVEAGCRHAILGPNGSGKSTLFRIAATLLELDSGTLSIFDSDCAMASATVRRTIGVVFQNPSLDAKLTAIENLMYAGRLYGLSRARARTRAMELLERFAVLDRKDDRVEELSGGLARRVEIGKAMVHSPRLLLLDEPSTGLDPTARLDLVRALDELRVEGVTVLFTTHLFDEADAADVVTILDRGKVVANGAPTVLKAELGGVVLRVTSRDEERCLLALRSVSQDSPRRVGAEFVLGGDGIEKHASAVAERLGPALEHLEIARPSLDDVFARATGRTFHMSERSRAKDDEEGSP